ncbi:Basic helix-loop-helix DNA-binding superfamily protein, putative isoform 2 [Hibiscus syriacus]|uniref:Basic helix-loop-helix DNA-binding superfamily protein, putative isoform 2 n=1 Tax=Hibiscus syriacus TaxID=106335 RepID=A0A6A2Y8L1_HIBSY|nr:transcription factor bHLH30-like [Hibiscus syriacus]KAE8673296.1 Basic helix-loop-helix DNA-binding superfamily protein, putative isoform 2 [Hibiscus syriacus]
MAAYYLNNNFSFENCCAGFLDPFSRDLGPCDGISHGWSLSAAASQSLVLDSEKGELVKTAVKAGKKSVTEEKAIAALRSHSEAERRRRERINAHLDTLRTILPTGKKMDKATLLGEVVAQLKQLKKNATEASKGFLVPMDDDEVRVDACDDDDGEAIGTCRFKASICCDYRPELLTDLRRALDTLPVKMVKAEISTLGSRLRNDFVFIGFRTAAGADDAEVREYLARSIRQAMSSVLEKASLSAEYSLYSIFPKKRQRLSSFDSSSSSS